MGSRSPTCKGNFWGQWAPIVKYRDFLPSSAQKWLNRSICHLACGLEWAEECTSSIVFARWHQCALMGRHIWRHLSNTIEPSVCGGDAALCQTTMTTCYYFDYRKHVTVLLVLQISNSVATQRDIYAQTSHKRGRLA